MTKFCTECGYENLDIASFCANCGKPFDDNMRTDKISYYAMFNQNDDSDSQSNENDYDQISDNQSSNHLPPLYKDHDIIEKSTCFYCNHDTFLHLYKESFFSERWVYFCTHCGVTLEKRGMELQLIDINDKTKRIWSLYGLKTLSKSEWERIGRGGLSNSDQVKRDEQSNLIRQKRFESQSKNDLEIFIQQLSNGQIQINPFNSSLILQNNEEAYFSIPNVALAEATDGRVYQRMGTDSSFLVANGTHIPASVGQSKCDSHMEVKGIDIGTLVITNKRLIFLGSKKSVNINLKKIIFIEEFRNGISIQRENKQKVEYFLGTNKTAVNFTIDGRKHTKNLEGNIIKAIILGQISKLSKKTRKVEKTNKIEMITNNEGEYMEYPTDVPPYVAHLIKEHEKKYGKTEKNNKINILSAEESRAKIARNKAKFLK